MLIKIVWKNIIHKKLNSLLCIILMTFGVSIISLILNISKQLEAQFTKNISGIDMVVGAKGSPLQLILSGIFHIDSPTGNIPLSEVEKLSNNPLVKEIIPLSIGDNAGGFRIIGTNYNYIKHFDGKLKEGKTFTKAKEVVIGSNVANKLNLKVNDTFESAHGLDKEGEKHGDEKYTVCGILEPTNSVLNNLIICSLESVWEIHDDHHTSEDEKEITCILVKFRSPMGMLTIPRNINSNTKLQAALPAIEVNRLLELLGVGVVALKYLAYLIMLISGLSVFITLYNSLKERKYEMALMLSLGATRLKLFLMLLLEGIILSFFGYIFGILLSRLVIMLLSKISETKTNYGFIVPSIQQEEIILLIAALFVGTFAAAIPSIGIYKINISKTLASE